LTKGGGEGRASGSAPVEGLKGLLGEGGGLLVPPPLHLPQPLGLRPVPLPLRRRLRTGTPGEAWVWNPNQRLVASHLYRWGNPRQGSPAAGGHTGNEESNSPALRWVVVIICAPMAALLYSRLRKPFPLLGKSHNFSLSLPPLPAAS